MNELSVNICESEKSYPIYITNCEIQDLVKTVLDYIGQNNYVIVISKKVYNLYKNLLSFPKDKLYILKDGEQEKNIKNYEKIINFTLKKKLTRKDYIIALGGGVVGDITGFVASTYKRGIKFIQIPTTLLACTDSSVGGKTAINSVMGKNLVGTFYQPDAVFIYTNFLKTLDNAQFKSGMGEVLKYGFIEKSTQVEQDYNLINFLNNNIEKIMNRDNLTLQELIEICIKLKISVVQKDEKESGLRKILNYGHTYAHAVETITKYKKFTHGECVVEGIYKALNIAYNLNYIDKEYYYLCIDLIKKFGYKPMPKFNKNTIIDIIKSDKKATTDNISYILPIGYAQVKEFLFSHNELNKTLFSGD